VRSRGEDPIGGLVDQPQADTSFGNGCQTDIYGGKIENAYTSRCFLKRTHAAVLSDVQLTIRIGGGW